MAVQNENAKSGKSYWIAPFPVHAGDVIMRNEPWLYSLHPEHFGDYCYRCFVPFGKDGVLDPDLFAEETHVINGDSTKGKTVESLFCPGCGIVKYCSVECQVADKSETWRHGNECALLKALRAKAIAPHHDLLLILKLIARLQSMSTDKRPSIFLDKGRKFSVGRSPHLSERRHGPSATSVYTERDYSRLVSHAEDILGSELWMKDVQQLRQLLALLLWEADVPDLRNLAEMYGKTKVNSFDIRNQYQHRLGEGVYLEGSQFDHSCERNAVFYFERLTLVIKATEDIPDLSQVRLAYTELFTTTAIRQQNLQKWFFFMCTCGLCADPHKEAELECILCCTPACQRPIPLSFDLDHRDHDPCPECLTFVEAQLSLTPQSPTGSTEQDSTATWNDFNWHDDVGQRMRLTRRLLAIDNRQHEKMHRFLEDDTVKDRGKILEEVEHRCRRMLETSELLLHPTNWMRCLTHNVLGKALLATGDAGKRAEAGEHFALSLPGLRQGVNASDPRLGLQLLLAAVLPIAATEADTSQQVQSEKLSEAKAYAAEARDTFALCDGKDRVLYRIADSLTRLCEGAPQPVESCQNAKYREWLEKTLKLLSDVVCRSLFPAVY